MDAPSPATYANPVYAGYFADPFVWRCGAVFHVVGTGADEAAGAVAGAATPTVFPLLRSTDLVHWVEAGHALVRPDPSFGNAFWAPEVVESGGLWYLYYSVGHDDRRHQLRVAVSERAAGPYVDAAALTSPDEVPFAIDPHPFRDDDGRWYLFHARDFLEPVDEQGGEVRCGTALAVSPLAGMTTLGDEVRTVARARCDWQRFAAQRSMYGRVFDWHTLEGPFVVRDGDGRYCCLYSGGGWHTDTYGVDYVVATSIAGPWSDAGAEQGPRVLRTVPGRVIGPGHCSVVRTGAGAVIAYHAWDAGMTARRLCIDPLVFTPHGPRALGPSWTPRPAPLAAGRTRAEEA
jgi:GH43 family beta-xylosidase